MRNRHHFRNYSPLFRQDRPDVCVSHREMGSTGENKGCSKGGSQMGSKALKVTLAVLIAVAGMVVLTGCDKEAKAFKKSVKKVSRAVKSSHRSQSVSRSVSRSSYSYVRRNVTPPSPEDVAKHMGRVTRKGVDRAKAKINELKTRQGREKARRQISRGVSRARSVGRSFMSGFRGR